MWGIFRIFALSIRNLGTMKITLIIKKSVKRYDTESKATIYARLRDGRQVDMVAPTRLTINPNLWDDKAEQVKSKIVCDDEMRSFYNDEARKLKSYLEKAYQSRQTAEPQKEWLKEALEQYYNPQKVQCRNGHGRNGQTDIDRIVRRISRKAPSFRCPQKELPGHQTRITAV